MSKEMAALDLSHLYQTETLEIAGFSVTIRSIPHGEMVEIQRKMFGQVNLSRSKKELDRQLNAIQLDAAGFSDAKNVAAIQSWTLRDAAGNEVPVSLLAWQALPNSITEEIEKGIERLNPDLDEEFQNGDGNESQS